MGQSAQHSLKKDPSVGKLLEVVKENSATTAGIDKLQQFHLNALQQDKDRLSTGKPVLGGGVAGSKYLIGSNFQIEK